MSRLAESLLRALGLLLLLGALGFAASKAPDRPLESLVLRWAPPPSEFIDLQGQLVHLRDQGPAGDKLPIVLIHGTSASLHTWEGWVKELSKTRRVISFDLPGFGLTGPAASGDYSADAYVEFVRKLLDHLQLDRVVLGGNSLGGEIAWMVAAAAPERVAALILVDAGGYAFTPESVPIGFQLARLPGLGVLSEYMLPRSVIEHSVKSVYGDPAKISPALLERYYELTLRAGNRAALRQRINQMVLGDQAERIKTLHQPTLILWGAKDRLIPPSNGAAFARDIPASQLITFPGLGHVPQEEDPIATVATVQSFLTTLKP
ncbi:alpha/beta fold hydrolase [Roseateles oligotrophus]|uniref:Alpha/beta hydrolase n=1 Tax=Roseateles oligotrophus TaxID=1769250 RepID=A0ABT2YGL3_9BURK|nr:alpha/beta hydrolase [Roseateles oligotrophus]MCV2369186.1 alpha/beta hydrolase [Roseateles oligotrophus]